jgi:signal transduction histidine kinase
MAAYGVGSGGAATLGVGRVPVRALGGMARFLAGQAGPVASVALVVFLLVLFRQLVGAAGARPDDAFAAHLWQDFYQHFFVALVMLVLIQWARRLGPQAGWPRIATLVTAVLLAAAVGASLRVLWMLWIGNNPASELWRSLPYPYPRFAVIGGLLTVAGEFHRAQVRSIEAMRAADADRAALEQQTLQARLKTLEAQIEPHFLFNTLATVRRLYEIDPAGGEAMMERLMRYLAVALPSMRDDRSTLEREAQLLESYLELQHVRMGRRLAYAIDFPAALRPVEVPPMMLLTLVENAIKHGLAPLERGGLVRIVAEETHDVLRVRVEDTGRGLAENAGTGLGLANIESRLTAMFGADGALSIEPNEPTGVVARIDLPLRFVSATNEAGDARVVA